MKLKLIALATLLAATGAAQAKIADSNDRIATSGDMFASVKSTAENANFTADLGLRLDQFIAAPVNAIGVKLVWDFKNSSFADLSHVSTGLAGLLQPLNYGSVWNSFATPDVLATADLKYDVKAMDGTPTTVLSGSGQNRYLSTSPLDTLTTTNNHAVFLMDDYDVFVKRANEDTTNSTHGTDIETAGANMFDLGDSFQIHYDAHADNWKGQTTFDTPGFVKDPLNFFFLSNSSKTAAHFATISKFDGTWSFDKTSAQLIYQTAPIPEAETYAMMLAGLGLVGFMARRRLNRAV